MNSMSYVLGALLGVNMALLLMMFRVRSKIIDIEESINYIQTLLDQQRDKNDVEHNLNGRLIDLQMMRFSKQQNLRRDK